MSKTCLNCGSPVHGYADTCGGLACRSLMDAERMDKLFACKICGEEKPVPGINWRCHQWFGFCQGCNAKTLHKKVYR